MIRKTLIDYSGQRRQNIDIELPNVSDTIKTLRQRLFIELNKDTELLIPEESICIWQQKPATTTINILTEIIQGDISRQINTPSTPPSFGNEPEIEGDDEKQTIEPGELLRPVIEFEDNLYYMVFADFVRQISNMLPKLPDDDKNSDSIYALEEFDKLINIAFFYWPQLTARNNSKDLIKIIYNTIEQRQYLDISQNISVTIAQYSMEQQQPQEVIKKLVNSYDLNDSFTLTMTSIEIAPPQQRKQHFVNLQQLFYYFKLDRDMPFKTVKVVGERQQMALLSEIREHETETLIEKWLHKSKFKTPQFMIKTHIRNDHYATVRFRPDGIVIVSSVWSINDTRSIDDKIQECITAAEKTIYRINRTSGKRPVFVTINGLPSNQRYREVIRPEHHRMLVSDAVLMIPINMKMQQFKTIVNEPANMFIDFAEIKTTTTSQKQIVMNYTRNNTIDPVTLIFDISSNNKTKVTIRKSKGRPELESIAQFVRAIAQQYRTKYKTKNTKAISLKPGTIFKLWNDGAVSKIKILKHYNVIENESNYVTQCQQHRQPIVVTAKELSENSHIGFKYVMKYKNLNFVCDPKSENPYPGLGKHNQRLIPCCFSTDQQNNPNYKQHVKKQVDTDVKTVLRTGYILADDNKIIDPGRLGHLHGHPFARGSTGPSSLYLLFHNKYQDLQNTQFYRVGINQQLSSNFIRSILAVYDEEYFNVKDIVKQQKVETLQRDLIDAVRTHSATLFNSLNRGTIKQKYNGDPEQYATDIPNLNTHELLVDLVQKVLNLNIFIFEVKRDNNNSTHLLCHFAEQYFNPRNKCIFLIKREQTYEPIMLFKDKKTVMKRLFTYCPLDNKQIANVVYDLWRSICIPATRTVPGFKSPKTAYETYNEIKDDYKNIKQFIRGDRCEGLIIDDDNLLPVVASDPLFKSDNNEVIPVITVWNPLSVIKTHKYLHDLSVNYTNLNVKPLAQVTDNDDGQVVALLLENSLIVKVKATTNTKLIDLPIDENARYYPDIDEFIHSGKQLSDKRTAQARNLEKQADFWYNLRIQLATYFERHPEKRHELMNILDNSDYDYNYKQSETHTIIAHILTTIMNSRELRNIFPVNITSIRSNDYVNIYTTKPKYQYVDCNTFTSQQSCNTKNYCLWDDADKQCKPTPEQQILSKYYFSILHEILMDPNHHLITGKLGDMLNMIEKQQHTTEEIMML